jgi:hypothetical protein
MTTANDIIRTAMKLAGVLAVGQTPIAEDMNDCLNLLNSMLASWNQSRWLIWHLLDISYASTGAKTYTVGPSGNFNVTRPDRLQAAYVRQTVTASPNGYFDFPLQIMQTYEEYSEITLKSLTSWPTVAFYDPTLTQGTLYVWPIPSSQFEIHIIVKDTLGSFPTLVTEFNLPPEYMEALYYNLAARIRVLYRLPADPVIIALAGTALNVIRVANTRVANLQMPAELLPLNGIPTMVWPISDGSVPPGGY